MIEPVAKANFLLILIACVFDSICESARESDEGVGDNFKLDLEPQNVATVPFGSENLAIWKHRYENRFYIRPLAHLVTDSIQWRLNNLEGRPEVTFDLELINEDVKKHVFTFLRDKKRLNLSVFDVELIPMAKVRLVWRHSASDLDEEFKVVDHWKTQTKMKNKVSFEISCSKLSACKELASEMKTNVEAYDMFEFEYVSHIRKSQKRNLTIDGNHFSSGTFFADLKNFPGITFENEIFLNESDVEKLATETSAIYFNDLKMKNTYIQITDEIKMKYLLNKVLKLHKLNSKNFHILQWNSVFWKPNQSRPDILAKKLNNEIEEIVARDNNVPLIANSTSENKNSVIEASASIEKINKEKSISMKLAAVKNKLSKIDKNLNWNGKIFEPNPINLFSINLDKLEKSSEILSMSVHAKHFESISTVPVQMKNKKSYNIPYEPPELALEKAISKLIKLSQESAGKIDIEKQKIKEEMCEKIVTSEKALSKTISEELKSTKEKFSNDLESFQQEKNLNVSELDRAVSDLNANWPTDAYCTWAPHGEYYAKCGDVWTSAPIYGKFQTLNDKLKVSSANHFEVKGTGIRDSTSVTLRLCCKM